MKSLARLFVWGVIALLPIGRLHADPEFPLSTNGSVIVDKANRRFTLKSANWYGANLEKHVPGGLDHQPIESIVGLIKDWGFNSIRLTFSNQMLHDRNPVNPEAIRANPQLIGLTPLEIFDRTVEALTREGIAVILNNHSTTSIWCCGYDANGLWYHSGAYEQTVEMWENDWLMLVQRYRWNPAVVGADLRNEVRTQKLGATILPQWPNWGGGGPNDWQAAAQKLGNRIGTVNPDLLIIVEGINWTGLVPILGWGERPHLKPVFSKPIHLQQGPKLVYAAHNYAFIGPNHNGDDKTSPGKQKYGQMDEAQFRAAMDAEWGYVTEAERFYSAPVWLSEFGVGREQPSEEDRVWFKRLVDYLLEKKLGFAYWPLNHEGFGLISADWSHPLKEDWRIGDLQRLISSKGDGEYIQQVHFANLSLQSGDDRHSLLGGDWLPGASKGTCPDGQRIVGLSQDRRGMCSDIASGDLLHPDHRLSVEAVHETETRYHGGGDWASGYTKYECPTSAYVAGFSKHAWGVSGVLCAKAKSTLSSQCRTLWFHQGDNRASEAGGDFAVGSHKGQCSDQEYVGGIAQRSGKASALLCCML